jgi:hypothetical protein
MSLKGRPARPPLALPRRSLNDLIVVVAGLAIYALFITRWHAQLFGVAPLG